MTTIATPTVTQTVRPAINARRHFKQMGQSFATSYSFLGELMQNARRAGATEVRIETDLKNRSLEVIDTGCGVEDFQNLIELSTSGWEDSHIQLADKPFGMGLFSVFYACERVTIRSRGQIIQISLDDIINERSLNVVADSTPVEIGTRILLRGLDPKLLTVDTQCRTEHHQLVAAVGRFAAGFAIPVILNGDSLPQPFARRRLPGVITSIGFVSMHGIHIEPDELIHLNRSDTRYFLQGLPIEASSHMHAKNIVHLDSEQFLPLMPDRARLQDCEKQLVKVDMVLRSLAKEHIVQQKAAMPPRAFLLQYFRMAELLHLMRLFNDIPHLPAIRFAGIDQVTCESSEVKSLVFSVGKETISRESIQKGEFKAWRNSPCATTDGQWAATLLKVMQRDDIRAVDTSNLDAGHWIFDCTPDVRDFAISVEPINVQGSIPVDSGDWDSCTLTLVDAVNVRITSRVDSRFVVEHVLSKDWLLVPASPELDPEPNDYFQGQTICYFTRGSHSCDDPVYALQSFTDEYGHFSDDLADDAKANWESLESGLLGNPMSATLQMALNDAKQEVTPSQMDQVAAVRLVRHWNQWDPEMTRSRAVFDVVNLAKPEFWQQVATHLSALGEAEMPARLMQAFTLAMKPNELVVLDGESIALLQAAGCSLRGNDHKYFVLKPGEVKPDFDGKDLNYFGFFESEELAIETVCQTIIRDTVAFHGMVSDAFEALAFPQKWKLVQQAHAQRVADARS